MDLFAGRTMRQLTAILAAAAVVLISVPLLESPADAVSSWSGKDPYHDYGSGACGTYTNDNHVQYMDATLVYAGSTKVGTGFLAYSPKCQTNWGYFVYYDEAARDQYSVVPSAWESGKTGTDQYSPDLGDATINTLMVDGRSTACAGAQLYAYPNHWITWYTFGCE